MPVAVRRVVSVTVVGLAAVVCTLLVANLLRSKDSQRSDASEQDEAAAIRRSQELALAAKRTSELESRVAELEDQLAARERAAARASGRTAQSTSTSGSAEGFTELERRLGGRLGAVYGPVSGPAVHVGSWDTGPAWSTIKVPIAIAVSREHGGQTPSMGAALTASDNAAATRLWDSLGTPSGAARKVEAALASAGDTSTRVQSQTVRSGFTSFGQTIWTLQSQQRFAAGMSCVGGAGPVVALMGQVDSSQRWGLGTVGANQRFKGGWGPSADGNYLVRQFGLIDLPSGTVAVAMAAEPEDGTFQSGIRDLNEIARWLVTHARGSGKRNCS